MGGANCQRRALRLPGSVHLAWAIRRSALIEHRLAYVLPLFAFNWINKLRLRGENLG